MKSVTAGRYVLFGAAACIIFSFACTREKPEPPKAPPIRLIKPKPQLLTQEQRAELGFPPELIARVEAAAGTEAEPFFETVMFPAENLKGRTGIERNKLVGFSVRTKQAEEIIAFLSPVLRQQGFLVFRSKQNYGSVPDVVTVVRGKNSYDILKIQKTEAPDFGFNTKAIIVWLKARQREAPFVITGADADRVEARFIRRPRNWTAFADKIYAFAPDVVDQGTGTIERLIELMKKSNGFYLWWD